MNLPGLFLCKAFPGGDAGCVYIVNVILVGPLAEERSVQLPDLLRAAALPGDRLDHIYVQSAEGMAEAALFVSVRTPAEAQEAVSGLCARMLAAEPAGWSMRTCQVVLAVPFTQTTDLAASGQASSCLRRKADTEIDPRQHDECI
jgi:hypothetical protein